MPRDKANALLASRRWKKANKLKVQESLKKWKAKNPEAVKRHTKKYKKANPDKVRVWQKSYRKNNPHKVRYHASLRAARIYFNGGKLPKNHKEILLLKQNGICNLCGVDLSLTGIHRDHIIPVCKGGKTVMTNIQLLCPKCNSTKGVSVFTKKSTPVKGWIYLDEPR